MTTMAPAPRAFKICGEIADAAIETIHPTSAASKAAATPPCSSPLSLKQLANSRTTIAEGATAAATIPAPARLPPRKRSRQQQQSRPLGSLPSPSGGSSGPAGGGGSSDTSGWWDVSNKENIDPRSGKQQQQQQRWCPSSRVSPFSPSLPVGVSSACATAHPRCRASSSTTKKRPLCSGGRCCESAVDNGGDGGAEKPAALSSRKPSREPLRELWNRNSCGGKLPFPVYLNALGARALR